MKATWGFVLAFVIGCGGGGLSNSGTGGGGGGVAGSGGGTAGTTGTGGTGQSPLGCGGCFGPSWTPPDAPDGGYSPSPPEGGSLTNGKAGCSSPSCLEIGVTPVAVDDSSQGFTAADLLSQIAGSGGGRLVWYDGTTTTLRLQIRYDQPAVSVSTGAGGSSGDAICRRMEVSGATITLSTDDGRLSGESFPAYVSALGPDGAVNVWAGVSPLSVSALSGSFRTPSSWASDNWMQVLRLLVTPQSATCSVFCPAGLGTDSWSDTRHSCGYDGKITWTASDPQMPCKCPHETTVATWQWNP